MTTPARRRDRLTRAQAHAAVLGTLPLAQAMARGGGEDVVAELHLGLCEAAATFEPSRGLQFTTHATWQVRHRRGYAAWKRSRAGMTYVPAAVAREQVVCRPNASVFADPEHAELAVPRVYDPEPDLDAEAFWGLVRRHAVCRLDYLIVRARYAHGLKLEEIAAGLGVTKTRVRQRIGRTLKRLRERAGEFEGFR